MALQLVTGAAGSGKSTWLYQHICREASQHPDRNYIVLVPDQFTLETQKTMVEFSGQDGILNIDVLSFQRLAYKALEIFPTYQKTILDDMGKIMVLRKVFHEEKKNLVYFKRGLNKPGFLDECKSFFCELMQYSVTGEDFLRMEESLGEDSLMSLKLKDLRLIYQKFLEKMGQSYMMAEELVPQLTSLVSKLDFMQDVTICLDGFTGFTPTQYQLLEEILKISRDMYITVTTDRTGERGGIFVLSQDVQKKMVKMARDLSVEILDPVVTGRPASGAPYRQEEGSQLAFLEEHIFSYGKKTWEGDLDHIQIRLCKKPRDEAAYVARKIYWMLQEGTYKPEEIAIVVGRIEDYEQVLERELSHYHIRYFMDYKKSMGANALAEYLLSLMDLYRRNMDYESTIRFLRSGLSPLGPDQVDILDNYLVAKGRRGYRSYCQEWRYELKNTDLVLVNEYRETLLHRVEGIFTSLRGGKKTIRDFCLIFYNHLKEMGIYDQIQDRADQFQEEGQDLLAQEYRRIYRLLMKLFDSLVSLLGEEEVTFTEFQEILSAGISQGLLAFVPPQKNQVKICDLERSRLKDIKVLFFMGVTDDVIPGANQSPGILSEAERVKMEEAGIELAPQGDKVSATEQFYLYLTLTKPSDLLFVTFCKLGSDGMSKRPAYLVDKIKRLYPGLKIQDQETMELTEEEILSSDGGRSYLMTHLAQGDFEEDSAFWQLAAYYAEREPDWWKSLVWMRDHRERKSQISREAAEVLYGNSIFASVTRMERYAACPFSFFINYGLGLREREEYEVKSMDYGNIFHSAMESLSHGMEKEGKSWDILDLPGLHDLAEEAIIQATETYTDDKLHQTKRVEYSIDRLKRVFHHSVEAQWKQMKMGSFQQKYSEKKFPEAGENLKAYTIDLGNGKKMTLNGQIDRVDVSAMGEKNLVKIMDYKSSNKDLKMDKVYYGIQLQLMTYMAVALELVEKSQGKKVEPAALLYYTMQRPDLEWKKDVTEAERQEKNLMEMKCRGYSNLDPAILEEIDEHLAHQGSFIPSGKSMVVPVSLTKNMSFARGAKVLSTEYFGKLMDHTRGKLKEFGQEIYEGHCQAEPYKLGNESACTYCKLKGLCGMDRRSMKERELDPLSDDEVWRKIDGEI
ncbi:MAG: PD-(D/E)XK nuclease family protein [Eubacterium sp.]|nr:PD-(D/E)XK nuclease family protein [Eubacterium sp.]